MGDVAVRESWSGHVHVLSTPSFRAAVVVVIVIIMIIVAVVRRRETFGRRAIVETRATVNSFPVSSYAQTQDSSRGPLYPRNALAGRPCIYLRIEIYRG